VHLVFPGASLDSSIEELQALPFERALRTSDRNRRRRGGTRSGAILGRLQT